MSFIDRPTRLRMFDRHVTPRLLPPALRWPGQDEQAGDFSTRDTATSSTPDWREDRYPSRDGWR
jgi:hypothetical protein